MADRLLRNLAAALRRDPLGCVLLALVGTLVLLCLLAPIVTRTDPTATDFARMLMPPSAENWLGTDDFGRDVFARLLFGGRTSLGVAAVAVMIVMGIGVVAGIVAGYFGGAVDLVLGKLIDVLMAFPRLVLAIAVAALMGGGIASLIVAISVVAWPAYARILRAFTLQVANEGYVQAARTLGTPVWRILGGHVALNLIGPILVLAMLDLGNLILAISALSFLGLGVAPPGPEWGSMLNEGRALIEIAPWMVLAPGMAIFLVVLSANYFADIARDSTEGRAVHGPRDWIAPSRPVARPELPSPNTKEPLLSFEGVTVDVVDPRSPYCGRRILQEVSFWVRPRECVGLIGESGSGKSTLAMLAMGLTRPPLALTGGAVLLSGTNTAAWRWDDWRGVRGRHVGLVNQDPLSALNPVLTIGDQISEVMAAHDAVPTGARAGRLRAVVDDVGLPASVVGRYPHELSGGMRQRVVIAMAIVNRPALLIADEPTTALDVSTQRRILDLIRDLGQQYGLSVLFVSHDLRVIARVADRVVILREGRVVETGTTAAVFAAPREPYTRALMAAIPGQHRQPQPVEV
ncbi:MAG: dipeptide/oligopeptide/nickel ABC transporter permease/ATP-binding protein [Natronohydrobacter sp.]|nr:dipeptide/oligopeptide/nickel ABC transporter permease/ATP-binding protein [Natronohydrobacter sp.]